MPTRTITTRALIARINRRLAPEELAVRKAREGTRLHHSVGDFYLLRWSRNEVVDTHLDVEAKAREVGVLAHDERLAD